MKQLIFIALLLAASSAQADQLYGRVTNVVANYQTLQGVKPDCEYQTSYRNGPNTGTFLGGVSGGLIGTQIGGGTGTLIATGIGAVLGAFTGQSIVNRNPKTEMLCRDVFTTQQVRAGYLVTIASQGHYFNVFLDHNPGVGARMPLQMGLQ